VTSLQLRSANPAKTRTDVVVIGVRETSGGPQVAPGAEDVGKAFGRRLRPLLSALGVTGKAGETHRVPTDKAISAPMLVLVGLGRDLDQVAVRRGAGAAARAVTNAASVTVALPADTPELVRAVTEGWLLGGYRYDTYRTVKSEPGAGTVTLLSDIARRKEAETAFEEAQVIAEAVAATRDWVNAPAADLTPPEFARQAADAAKVAGRKVKVTVLDEDQMAELGCGGILGVGGGSDAPPRLVELRYAPRGARAHLALVGKGITFDSGGYSIKPAASMNEMKTDMGGAAAVIQATIAIARLGLPIKVTAYAAMAENMVSGRAMRPGDVLTMYGGKTVEVLNTDAEGRLVMADALVRATEEDPDVIVDVATLTGHMQIALGDRVAGAMGSEEIVEGLLASAETAGEALWPMPIPEEMTERLQSKIADVLQHDWIRWGGGVRAAAFLREFVDGRPWGHLDIAGPAYHPGSAYGHIPSGGTGYAVSTLVEYARDLSASDE
jgi:leucyl aminopeptidase